MTERILLDVTSLIAAPVRSGIQRVERELIQHWPEPDQLILVSLNPSGQILRLPEEARDVLCQTDQPSASVEHEQRKLKALVADAFPLPPKSPHHLLNLELFFESWRADTYLGMCHKGRRVQWLVYDFMPWLHPELFPHGTARSCMHYLRALRQVPEVAFISRQTRYEYTQRIMRGRGDAGPVLPLGADGLRLEKQSWSPGRRDVVLVGTVEKRKNIHLVIEAFRRLWASSIDVRLVLAGRIEPPDRARIDSFAAEAGPGRLEVLEHATDAELRTVLRQARAVLYASAIEGFGLPPYEAIESGIPAIASATLPSVQLLPPRGHIRLTTVTSDTLAEAVRLLMDDEIAARLWREAAEIELPSWHDFGNAIWRWATGDAAGDQ